MIKINLFPFRAARIKENIRRQVTVYVLSAIFLILLLSYHAINLNMEVKSLRQEQDVKTKELASFKETNIKIKRIKKTIAEVELKLNTIKELEKVKTGPVLLLDDISTSIPKNKLWLRNLKEYNGILTLEGTAMDNETVADFMNRLEETKSATSVQLIRTQQREITEPKLSLKDFLLTAKTYAFKEEPSPETDKEKKGKKR